jgi:Ca2+-binding RTX toxin-like protein
VVNHGTINVAFKVGMVIALSAGNDSVVNNGKMIGHVSLGAGNDSMDTRGGSVSGKISGDAGNDTLIIESAKYKLLELVGRAPTRSNPASPTRCPKMSRGSS